MTTPLVRKKSELLDTIVARASSPLERLRQETKDDQRIHDQSWQESLPHLYRVLQANNEEEQKRFLAHLGFDEPQLITALSLPASAKQITASSWITVLDRVLSEYTLDLPQEALMYDRSCFPKAPLPFEELFLPFIRYARQQIQSQVPECAFLLSLEAQIQLEHWLLNRLSVLAQEPLWLDYASFRTLHDEISILDEQRSQRLLYDRFLSRYAGEEFLDFFARYSLLARLLIQIMEQWIETCAEFLERLKADSNLITRTFFDNHPSGHVLDIQIARADQHHHGRTVFLLTFADDHKLVYKPRCMAIDEAFFRCIKWLNEKGLSPDLKPVRVLNRNTYGWMEYIKHTPCTTSTEVRSYYQRCGLFICLFYVLGSTDMHYENLIAHGAYPIPIDLETIFTPLFRTSFFNHSSEEQKVKFSVSRSGMLVMKAKYEGMEINTSGLTDVQILPVLRSDPVWRNINTDTMMLSYEDSYVSVCADNKVISNGVIAKPSEYVEELVTGFRDMYHFLQEHRTEIIEDGAMLNFFVGCPIRYVYRPTSIYGKQLLRLRSSDLLQDGTRAWIASQIFKRILLKDDRADHRHWSIVSCELASLARRDVPRFSTHTNGTHIYSDDIFIEDVLQESAMQQTRSCIARMCDEDMEQQIALIYENILPDSTR